MSNHLASCICPVRQPCPASVLTSSGLNVMLHPRNSPHTTLLPTTLLSALQYPSSDYMPTSCSAPIHSLQRPHGENSKTRCRCHYWSVYPNLSRATVGAFNAAIFLCSLPFLMVSLLSLCISIMEKIGTLKASLRSALPLFFSPTFHHLNDLGHHFTHLLWLTYHTHP